MAGPSRPATRSCRSRTITIRRFITATSATRVDPNVPAAGLAGLGGLRGTTFVDPADPGAGFHYHGPALVAREPEAVEHARVARGRAACLLDPAMQIIGGASGEILDRLDAVLAQGDQHRRADSGNFAQRGLDAQLPAPGSERVPGAFGGSARFLRLDRLGRLSQPEEHGRRTSCSRPGAFLRIQGPSVNSPLNWGTVPEKVSVHRAKFPCPRTVKAAFWEFCSIRGLNVASCHRSRCRA